ncbi:saccharopine dehydrogenase family protein [Gordonia malaquae]|uniref:saccharopine dehydrogenase family protein n=1 Tax=Gordonia malaquae TaxID=410332 RepID=UPI003BF87875
MCTIAVQRFCGAGVDVELVLYDLDEARLRNLAATLPGTCEIGRLDIFDSDAVRDAIADAALVVLGAGPYLKTSKPVIDACIAAGVDYLDYADDVAPTLDALDQDSTARERGIAAYIGCGSSPGLLNIMAVDAAGELEQVESIDVCWCTGDEGARPYGAAVIEHLFHIAAGECLLWRDGKATTVESYATSEQVEMGGTLGTTTLYTCAHPESATLPRVFPEARSIRVLGGLDPAPVNAIARGVAVAVRDGDLDAPTAIAFFQQIMQDKPGTGEGWRHAFPELVRQVRRGEETVPGLLKFVANSVVSRHLPYRGGLLARVTGSKHGSPMEVTVRTTLGADAETSFLWSSMGTITGTSIAAFMVLALERADLPDRGGVFSPEEWVTPAQFYDALLRVGTPAGELPIKQITAASGPVPDQPSTAQRG